MLRSLPTRALFEIWFERLKKYPVGRFVKISRLLYQTVQKKHPGVLFKDFALFVVKESAKRWLYVYLHDKIALEANHAYKASLT